MRGLYEYLLPIFTQKTGIAVKVLAQGTGQALATGRRGDADVVFVHAKFSEQMFIAEGHGVKRFPVMYNDFVLVGPGKDPAAIKGMDDVAEAFKTIRDKHATFISRGDHSGTHLAELALWNKDAGIDVEKDQGTWYEPIGRGMDETLYMASARGAYALTDRAAWLHFENKDDLQILVAGDVRLFNQYAVILVIQTNTPMCRKSSDRRSSTGWCRLTARRPSPTTRSMANSYFFRTPTSQTHELAVIAVNARRYPHSLN